MRCTPACSEQVIAGAAQKEWTTPRPPNNRRQQPVPAIVAVMVSLMQKPWAVAVAAKVPEPGCCCCFGGMPYWPTVSTLVHQTRTMTLEANEFLRRFLLHVLPASFVRIRYFGLLANRHRAQLLA